MPAGNLDKVFKQMSILLQPMAGKSGFVEQVRNAIKESRFIRVFSG